MCRPTRERAFKLLYIKKAVADISDHRFLNALTIVTIGFAVLIVSTFTLCVINGRSLIDQWKQGVRITAYLRSGTDPGSLTRLHQQIKALYGVQDVVFISKDEALKRLRRQMQHEAALFENLDVNPLPDAFEVRVEDHSDQLDTVAAIAKKLTSFPEIDDVEYGQRWLGRFSGFIELFAIAGYALGALVCLAAVFFVANTVRLVIYSRRDEIEIMRLVGAEDWFIRMPFYFEGLIQGLGGALLGMAALFIAFLFITEKLSQGTYTEPMQLHFLPMHIFLIIIAGSTLVGWLGCSLSLRQYLKS